MDRKSYLRQKRTISQKVRRLLIQQRLAAVRSQSKKGEEKDD